MKTALFRPALWLSVLILISLTACQPGNREALSNALEKTRQELPLSVDPTCRWTDIRYDESANSIVYTYELTEAAAASMIDRNLYHLAMVSGLYDSFEPEYKTLVVKIRPSIRVKFYQKETLLMEDVFTPDEYLPE